MTVLDLNRGAAMPDRPDRQPPHNLEAERAVLGSLLLLGMTGRDPEPVLLRLAAPSFYLPKHRVIYEAMQAVHASGGAIDPVTVEAELASMGRASVVAGPQDAAIAVLADLGDHVPSPANVQHYVDLVLEKERAREAVRVAHELAGAATTDTLGLGEALAVARNRLDIIERRATGQKPAAGAQPFPTVRVRDIVEIKEQDWLARGLVPRFPSSGCAGYIFGPPKARKSLLLADLALSVATGTAALGAFEICHRGAAVGFYAEDPQAETSRRIHRMARARGLEVPEELHLFDIPALALDNPEHQARMMATLACFAGLALVWADPMVRLHSVNDNKAEELGPIHTFLRTLARTFPAAVVALAHHAGKASEFRGSTDYPAFGDFNLYTRSVDDLTTEVFRVENRGGPAGLPFRYSVEDGASVWGPTMRLVRKDITKAVAGKEAAVMEAIRNWRLMHPGEGWPRCMAYIKELGLKPGGSGKFFALWKESEETD